MKKGVGDHGELATRKYGTPAGILGVESGGFRGDGKSLEIGKGLNSQDLRIPAPRMPQDRGAREAKTAEEFSKMLSEARTEAELTAVIAANVEIWGTLQAERKAKAAEAAEKRTAEMSGNEDIITVEKMLSGIPGGGGGAVID